MIKVVLLKSPSFSVIEEKDITYKQYKNLLKKSIKCEVPNKLGISLLIHRQIENPYNVERDKKYDNRPATYLMIQESNGFAPDNWQFNIGDVFLLKKKKKNFTMKEWSYLHGYICHLLDMYGNNQILKTDFRKNTYDKYLLHMKNNNGDGTGSVYLSNIRDNREKIINKVLVCPYGSFYIETNENITFEQHRERLGKYVKKLKYKPKPKNNEFYENEREEDEAIKKYINNNKFPKWFENNEFYNDVKEIYENIFDVTKIKEIGKNILKKTNDTDILITISYWITNMSILALNNFTISYSKSQISTAFDEVVKYRVYNDNSESENDNQVILTGEDRTYGGNKLFVDLIPKTCWFTNVRSCVATTDWDRLRNHIYSRVNNKCECCNSDENIEAHERWDYDDKKLIQKLVRLVALCKKCHEATHMGLAGVIGKGEKAKLHLKNVRQFTDKQCIKHIDNAFNKWEKRSQKNWDLDLSLLTSNGIKLQKKVNKKERKTISENKINKLNKNKRNNTNIE